MGVCGDKRHDQLPFRCTNNFNELVLLVSRTETFLEGPQHQPFEPNINFILHVSGYIVGIVFVIYVSGYSDLD